MTGGFVLPLLGGLLLLTLGAGALVRGASRLALLAGVSPIVVGLTVVAVGTSTPELAVSLGAALHGRPDLAVGNVVGSNVFNVLFVLGAAALVTPRVVARQAVRLEVPILVGVSVLVWELAADHRLSAGDGVVLLALMVAHAVWTVRRSRREIAARREDGGARERPTAARLALALLLSAVGVLLLLLGARWLLAGSAGLAEVLGVSDLVVGLTAVAAATSMPEVIVSVLVTRREERDVAVGAVVGANIVNLLGVLGVVAVLTPGGLAVADPALQFDLPVMTAVAITCLPIFLTGYGVGRREAGFLLLGYGAYAAYLVLEARQHDALPAFSAVMLEFALPLAALGLGVSLWRAWKEKSGDGGHRTAPY